MAICRLCQSTIHRALGGARRREWRIGTRTHLLCAHPCAVLAYSLACLESKLCRFPTETILGMGAAIRRSGLFANISVTDAYHWHTSRKQSVVAYCAVCVDITVARRKREQKRRLAMGRGDDVAIPQSTRRRAFTGDRSVATPPRGYSRSFAAPQHAVSSEAQYTARVFYLNPLEKIIPRTPGPRHSAQPDGLPGDTVHRQRCHNMASVWVNA
jgi:hypothetical protein